MLVYGFRSGFSVFCSVTRSRSSQTARFLPKIATFGGAFSTPTSGGRLFLKGLFISQVQKRTSGGCLFDLKSFNQVKWRDLGAKIQTIRIYRKKISVISKASNGRFTSPWEINGHLGNNTWEINGPTCSFSTLEINGHLGNKRPPTCLFSIGK